MSHLREALYEYELHVNDLKTSIIPGVTPLDDPWASRLRASSEQLKVEKTQERITSFFNDAVTVSTELKTQSPLKLAVRRADKYKLYRSPHFQTVENHLQRMVHHFPHAIDYICLFVAKRVAIGEAIDAAGWAEIVNTELMRHLILGHHHEACWLFWLAVVCGLEISARIIEEIPKHTNQHLLAMTVVASVFGKCNRPRIRFSAKIASDSNAWLVNLIARSVGFTRAPFGGCFADECEHLVQKKLQLIDFDSHLARVAAEDVSAISNVRFGYEDEYDEDDDDDDDDDLLPPAWGEDDPF